MNTIYVGNIQSIDDHTLREYFQRFGNIEDIFHNCSRPADLWLIDYRFIRFSSDTDINVFLSNKIDHTICRIRLDIHSYEAAFNDETRLTIDKKVCVAHTNPKLDRNTVKKSFTKYGRILNCTCVSSGNGVEYVYIEYDTMNSIRSIFSSKQNYFVARTSLAVKQPLRPSQVGTKIEYNYDQQSFISKTNKLITNATSLRPFLLSSAQMKNLEKEYDIVIQKDFDEITYQVDKYLRQQEEMYKKIKKRLH